MKQISSLDVLSCVDLHIKKHDVLHEGTGRQCDSGFQKSDRNSRFTGEMHTPGCLRSGVLMGNIDVK